jgi:hypothetical protein
MNCNKEAVTHILKEILQLSRGVKIVTRGTVSKDSAATNSTHFTILDLAATTIWTDPKNKYLQSALYIQGKSTLLSTKNGIDATIPSMYKSVSLGVPFGTLC